MHIVILLFIFVLLIVFYNNTEQFYQGKDCKNIETNIKLDGNIYAQIKCPKVCNTTIRNKKFSGNWDNPKEKNKNKPGVFTNWCECCR